MSQDTKPGNANRGQSQGLRRTGEDCGGFPVNGLLSNYIHQFGND